jgi:integrase
MTIRLTKTSIATLALPPGSKDAIFFDSELPGFGMRLRAGGSRKWIVQYQLHGHQQRRLTIGSVAVFDPDQARKIAREKLAMVRLGQDPQAEKVEAGIAARQTLSSVIERYLAEKASKLRPTSLRDARRHLLKHFRPLHGMPVHQIERRHVAAHLGGAPVETARARGSLSALFAWAIAEGLCDGNPVVGTRSPDADVRPRERVLSDEELVAVWKACGDDDYGRIVRLIILTGQRRQEVGGIRWNELDRERGTWTIPSERTKNKRPHMLTLPAPAWAIIETVPPRYGLDRLFGALHGQDFGGWSRGKRPLDERVKIAAWTLHDLRRTVATRMADLGVAPHVIEALLNHVSGHKAGVAGIYNRSSYEREVRAALALWADHVRSLIAGGERKIIPLPLRP